MGMAYFSLLSGILLREGIVVGTGVIIVRTGDNNFIIVRQIVK